MAHHNACFAHATHRQAETDDEVAVSIQETLSNVSNS